MREKYLEWLGKRITELEKEYDSIEQASYGTGLNFDHTAEAKLISKGGKLKGYKEIRDYINTHP